MDFTDSSKTVECPINKVDYIIPTWNSGATLSLTLESIRKHGNPNQIIIVDRGSTDGTLRIAEDFGCKVVEFNGHLGAGRRLGARSAVTELIAFVDSDVELNERWQEVLRCASDGDYEDAGIIGAYYAGSCRENSKWPLVFNGGNGPFGCTITRADWVEECEEMDKYSSAEDGAYARFLSSKGLKWYMLDVPLTHNHDLAGISVYKRWKWLGAGLRIRDGFRLVHIKSIMGGAIFGIKIKNLDMDYFENFKVRANYFIGYMMPKRYYEIDRSRKNSH